MSEHDNAVYPEDSNTFMNPSYRGKCGSVNILLSNKGRWLTHYSKQDETYQVVTMVNDTTMSPYQCLLLGMTTHGKEFIQSVLERLKDSTTRIYCMVYRGVVRNYYIIIDVSTKRLKLKTQLPVAWVHPAVILQRYPLCHISIFYSKMLKCVSEEKYGYRNVRLVGTDIFTTDKEHNIKRISIIPYYLSNDSDSTTNQELAMIMGINYSGCYADFGGGVKVLKGETPLMSLKRECTKKCGLSNWNLLLKCMSRADSTYCWYVNVANPDTYNVIILTQIDPTKFIHIEKNDDFTSTTCISFSDLITTNNILLHPPIRPFVDYISKPNYLIGYNCSLISRQGLVPFKSDAIVYPDPPHMGDKKFKKYTILNAPKINSEFLGRIYEEIK